MNPRIYFDHSATTPLDPRVLTAMGPYLGGAFGNPSSLHQEGRAAREAVQLARAQVAALIGAEPEEIIFTASGTEADNLALVGAVRGSGCPGHVVTSSIEHAAILETCRFLASSGTKIRRLPVDSDGLVGPESLLRALQSNVTIVSVMAANNVVGNHPAGRGARSLDETERRPLSHGRSSSGRKNPTRRKPVARRSALAFGAQTAWPERHRCALCSQGHAAVSRRLWGRTGTRSAVGNGERRRNRRIWCSSCDREGRTGRRSNPPCPIPRTYRRGTARTLPQSYLFGHPTVRLPGHLSFGLRGQEREVSRLLAALDAAGVAVSAGSACSANHAGEPSGVLLAMGYDDERARGLIRVSLGRFNMQSEIDRFLAILARAVATLADIASRLESQDSVDIVAGAPA